MVLLADVAVVVSWQLVLLMVRSFGIDIQPMKWPTVFYSGVLLLFAGALSVIVLVLQIIVALRRRSAEN
jgi:hypothetical protein